MLKSVKIVKKHFNLPPPASSQRSVSPKQSIRIGADSGDFIAAFLVLGQKWENAEMKRDTIGNLL